jgi:recombination protein RecA
VPKKSATISKAQRLAAEISQTLDIEVRLGSDRYFEITRIPTGSLVMDRITGGGFAHGRHVELFGDENVGKSLIAYQTMALSQARGNLCAVIDPEHSFDPEWFDYHGGNSEDLLAHHPDTADDAIAAMLTLADLAAKGAPIEVITIDSVSGLVPREETQSDPRNEPRIAGQARMMSRALRRLTTANRKIVFLWINQERTNVAIKFGNPRTRSGGKALGYYATTRIEMRRGEGVKSKRNRAKAGRLVERDVLTGRWIQLRSDKEKSTRPHMEGAFLFDVENGHINIASEIINLGLEDGLIERAGNNYSYVDIDDREWKGPWKKFSGYLLNNDELREEIVTAIQDETARVGIGAAND